MLYERWIEIVAQNPERIALQDLATGKNWTFQQLKTNAEALLPLEKSVHISSAKGYDLILDVLRSWRAKVPFCALEKGQNIPDVGLIPAECAHLKLTSGTTGAPLVVGFSGEQLFADSQNIISTMSLGPACTNIAVISMAHSYGFSNLVAPLLLFGIPLVIGKGNLPLSFSESLFNIPNCIVPAVPALWNAWFTAGVDLSRIKVAISAGAPLSIDLEKEIFQKQGLKIHNFYGSSECGGIAYDRTSQPRIDPNLAGTALDNVDLSLNEDNCVVVRSRAVGLRHFPEPLATLADGTFRTGDIAELRGNQLRLIGRTADLLNVAGRKVSPEKIELALLSCSDVTDVVVFAVDSSLAARGDNIVACIVANRVLSLQELKDSLSRRLNDWEMPRQWFQLNSLPRNDRGKLSRTVIKKLYTEGSLTGSSRVLA